MSQEAVSKGQTQAPGSATEKATQEQGASPSSASVQLKGMGYQQGRTALQPKATPGGAPAADHDHDHDHNHEEEAAADGDTEHTSAADADSAIREHLSEYVAAGVAAGRGITGHAEICGDDRWEVVGQRRYGDRWAAKRTRISAFVDRTQDMVYLHHSRGNPGTMIHEAIHRYCDTSLRDTSSKLNEAVTEYFTRLVVGQLYPGLNRRNYQDRYPTAVDLVGFTAEATVAAAYFDGNIAGLTAAFQAASGSANWATFIGHCSGERWADARAMMGGGGGG